MLDESAPAPCCFRRYPSTRNGDRTREKTEANLCKTGHLYLAGKRTSVAGHDRRAVAAPGASELKATARWPLLISKRYVQSADGRQPAGMTDISRFTAGPSTLPGCRPLELPCLRGDSPARLAFTPLRPGHSAYCLPGSPALHLICIPR